MRKLIGILALVMILCLAIAIPGLAVKIAPYSQPLHDIIHWDAKSAKLIIMNPEGESLTVSWPANVDLWNYDGSKWTYDLPTGDKFSFRKEVLFGYEGAAITYTEGEPVVEIWGYNAGTSGSVNAMPLYVHSVLAGEGQVGRAAEFVLAPSCVRMGAWGNAIKAKLDLSGDGVLGSIGLLAGVCAEVVTPAGQLNGSIAVVEHEIVATEGLALGDFLYSANTLTFLQFALSGHGAAVTEVDNHGQFFTINGLTADVGNMLSEGYVTLKGSVNDLKQMYLVMSRLEDGLKMGADGDALTLTTAIPLFQLWTTSASTTGTTISAVIQQTMTVPSGAYAEALRVQLRSDVKMGGSSNAIFAQLDYIEDGYAHGEGAVICAELSMPSVTSPIRGEYAFIKFELDVPAACSLANAPIALMKLNTWGGGQTEFDDHGVLFDFEGVVSNANDFFYLSDITVTKADGTLKIRINDVFYYLLFSTVQTGGD